MASANEILNVGYWRTFYEIEEVNTGQYERGMEKDTYTQRLEALWSWKGLNRAIDFEDVAPVLRNRKADIQLRRSESPERAVKQLSELLVSEDIVNHSTIVTPAFMLHVGDSGDGYSETFPIFDRRVWFAYSYLMGDRTGTESLPSTATTSPKRYGEFCEWFRQFGETDPQAFEQALFVFGGFLDSIPAETIDEKEGYIESLEETLDDYSRVSDFSLVKRPE